MNKLSQGQGVIMIPNINSSFEIALVNNVSIVLIDKDKGKSVTDDATNVISHLQYFLPEGIGRRTVFYRDSTGRFDQILVGKKGFSGFASCTDSQQEYLSGVVSNQLKGKE